MTRNATTRKLAAPALTLLLTAAATAGTTPAQAATGTATTTAATTTAGATANAGATWSQLMRRKLALDTEATTLAAQLPVRRAAVATRTAELRKEQQSQTIAANVVTAATAADQDATAKHTVAKTIAAKAKRAVAEEEKRRPRSTSRVAVAKKTLAAKLRTVDTRADAAGSAAAALTAARTSHAAATSAVTTATASLAAANAAVTATQRRIAALPKARADLSTQASALGTQVVTQTRASFTTAQTTQVYGVTVNKIVAYPFQRMIDDAAKAGIALSGGGFRTREQQIALRTINGCPDVWTAPSSSCRVPTAIPGRSLHELGLAVDITANKKTINDRKSAAFKWLAANAGNYGFVNLPSEPWHWSITGN